MNKIITISREFGSGGRELGKRLADYLNIPCYDQEIIDMVVQQYGLDEKRVAYVSEKDIRIYYPSTIANRFMSMDSILQQSLKTTAAQQKMIKQFAKQGDCVFVGRCADVICKEMNPFNIFVYADQQSKVERCRQRANANERFSEKEILKNMKQIDKEREAYRVMFTDDKWGNKSSYHLCVNTSNKEIKTLIPGIANYVNCWFE